jgi:hypothetical protein
MALDYLSKEKDIRFSQDRLGAIASYKLKGHQVHL